MVTNIKRTHVKFTCTCICADTGAGNGGQHIEKSKTKRSDAPQTRPRHTGTQPTRPFTKQAHRQAHKVAAAASPGRPRSTPASAPQRGAAVSGAPLPRPPRSPAPAQPSNKPSCRASPHPHPPPTCWAGEGATRGAGLCERPVKGCWHVLAACERARAGGLVGLGMGGHTRRNG